MYVNDLSFNPGDPLYDVPGLPGVQWGVQLFTTRNFYQLDPDHVTVTPVGTGLHVVCDGLRWAGQQQQSAGRVEVDIHLENGAVVWQMQAWHAEPIKNIKLMLWNLPAGALDKGWWQPTSRHDDAFQPIGYHNPKQDYPGSRGTKPLLWNYPWPEWLTPWACAGDASEAVCISIHDPEVRAKRLYVFHPPYASSDIVEIVCEEDAARWGGHFATPPICVRVCHSQAEIDGDFATHQAFLEQAYQLQPWETRRDVPDWMRSIKLVLTLHGMHWTGYTFNTYARMAETLRFVTQHIPGDQVLAYIPGWEGRYYYAYPFYQPSDTLGGSDGFKRLVDTGHELGAYLMPMFGMHGANIQLYSDWQRSAFRSRTDGFVKFVNFPDWDNDRSGDDDQVFLNPGEPTYRQHLLEQVSNVVSTYGVDGVFLDTSACWFNDPHYNLYEGYKALVGELYRRHPNVLVAGEGWYDAVLAVLPVNQSWLGIDRQFRYPQLLAKYGRALGHLANGTPGAGSTGVHEGGFYPINDQAITPGHIRSLGIVEDTLDKYRDDVIRICREAAQD